MMSCLAESEIEGVLVLHLKMVAKEKKMSYIGRMYYYFSV